MEIPEHLLVSLHSWPRGVSDCVQPKRHFLCLCLQCVDRVQTYLIHLFSHLLKTHPLLLHMLQAFIHENNQRYTVHFIIMPKLFIKTLNRPCRCLFVLIFIHLQCQFYFNYPLDHLERSLPTPLTLLFIVVVPTAPCSLLLGQSRALVDVFKPNCGRSGRFCKSAHLLGLRCAGCATPSAAAGVHWRSR